MKFKKLISVFLSITLVLISFGGCTDSIEEYTLYIETDAQPATLDPQLVSGAAEEIIVRNLFEGLMRLDADGNIVNGVAENYSISANGLSYTFNLRENAVWSNGERVVADDFVFAFERALSPKTKSPGAEQLYCIKNAREYNKGKNVNLGVKALTDSTLNIVLCEKNPDFLNILTTMAAMPCQRKAFNLYKGKYGMNDEDFISNGSFKLKSWVKDGEYSLKLVKNNQYKGDFAADASAVIFSAGEKENRFEKIAEGKLDMGFVNYSENNQAVKISEFSKTLYALAINPQSEFGKEKFKKALLSSVDINSITRVLEPNLEYTSKLLPSVISKDNQSLNKICDVTSSVSFNPENARESFLSGVAEYGEPESLTILYTGDDSIKKVALAVAEGFQKHLGIVANIKALETEEKLLSLINSGEYQLAVMLVSATSNSPTRYFNRFVKENETESYGFSSSEYNETFSGMADYKSLSEIVAVSNQLLEIIEQSMLLTPLFNLKEAFGYGNIYSCPKISPFDGAIDLALVKKIG